jgi:putative transposase
MGVWRRKPTQPVIIHSDQGRQFSSDGFVSTCKKYHLIASMSRRGDCYDNAVAENFLSNFKKDRIRGHICPTRAEARSDLSITSDARRMSAGFPANMSHHHLGTTME